MVIALYNNSVHSATGYTPNEIVFNQTDHVSANEIRNNTKELFDKVKENLGKASRKMEKGNNKEKPPDLTEGQIVFLKPNLRTKTQPRAAEKKAEEIKERTFKIESGVKRNKNKIKRLKKKYN
jgi:hypothetical protein